MIDLNDVEPTGADNRPAAPSFAETASRLGERVEDVARALLGEPNRALSTRAQWRYGTHGSLAIELDGDKRGRWYDHENGIGGGMLELLKHHTGLPNGQAVQYIASQIGLDPAPTCRAQRRRRVVATYDYHDELGALLFQVVRFEPKDFRQRRPDGTGGWTWSVKGVRQVPYRLFELSRRAPSTPVLIVEGEKDVDRLAALGFVATCNAGGANKWPAELNEAFRGLDVCILPDNDDAGRSHADRVARSLHGTASSIRVVDLPGPPQGGDVSDWLDDGGDAGRLVQLCQAASLAAVVNLARADAHHATASDDWDADPWALNTPEGIVDLRTGQMRWHDRMALCSKMTAAAPAAAACPLWMRFLDQVTSGDADLQRFLSRIAGYGLTGSTREHALFFFYGTGANGKGTFLNTLTAILGDYARIAGMDTFTESHSDRHPTELAMLRGARLVAAQETEEGRRWAESRIKALTGGDPVTARFMRQDFFTYTPQFKLLIAGNHKPGLRNIDEAIRRRFHLLPFTVRIPPEERDPNLFEKLKAEWPAILGCALRGCLEWQAEGLNPPAAVMKATSEYFDDEDVFGRWLEECCIRDAMAHETTRDLYAAWTAWAGRSGMSAGTEPKFRAAFKARGFVPKREPGTGRGGFEGIRLNRRDYSDDLRYGG